MWIILILVVLLAASPALADGIAFPGQPPQIGQSGAVMSFPPSSGGGCSQATTFLARTTGLSGTETTAYTNAICGMVADGDWSKLDFLYVFTTNTTTTALLNLVSTSYNLTSHGSPTFVADLGYTGDQSTSYLDTGFNPATAGGNYTQNVGAFGVCVTNNNTSPQNWSDIGQTDTAKYSFITPYGTGPTQYDLNGGSFPGYPSAGSQGSWIVTRTSALSLSLFLNGASVATPVDASSAVASQNFYILAYNNNGSSSNITGDTVGYAFAGGSINAANVYSRLHTLITAVGASGC